MAGSDFTVEGWDKYAEHFAQVVDKWDDKLKILLQRIGLIMEREISPLIPVDTSNLVSKFSIEIGGDYVVYGTNVEYAIYVDEGHVQHKRFLPIKYLSVGGRAKYIKGKNQKGIMLKEKYVKGAHFIDKGMEKANPRIDRLCESFIEQVMREAEGSSL